MNKLKILLFYTPMLILSLEVFQSVTEKGVASIELNKSTCRDGRPADRNKHFEAIEKAKISAWNKYTSNLSSDRLNAYYASEDRFLAELDQYITDYVILTTDCSKTNRNYTISLRVTIMKLDSIAS